MSTVKVTDLMTTNVVTGHVSQSVEKLKNKMQKAKLSLVPIVDDEEHVVGVVSAKDVLAHDNDQSPVKSIMTKKVYSVPEYEKVETAARIMRNHKVHHLVVTSEKKLIGIISSYDLLKLVEGHGFTMKQPGTKKSKGAGKRSREEARQ